MQSEVRRDSAARIWPLTPIVNAVLTSAHPRWLNASTHNSTTATSDEDAGAIRTCANTTSDYEELPRVRHGAAKRQVISVRTERRAMRTAVATSAELERTRALPPPVGGATSVSVTSHN